MSDLPVLITEENGVGRITLNRPKALHALNTQMCEIMTDALLKWRNDDQITMVLVDHAEGSRGFCAGGDIRMLAESGAKDGIDAMAFFASEYRLNTLIFNYPKPYIACLDGVTMGGGVGISVHGDVRIATENSTFAMPESGIGLFPDVGGGWFLPRLEGALGVWLALTGARLKGEDVLAAGVATHFVSSEALPALKANILKDGLAALEGMQTTARASFADHVDIMNACFGQDTVEAVYTALAADGGEWATKQLATLKTKSPTTMKTALRQIHEGAKCKTFEDNMRMEYRIGARIVRSADFAEGVRAVIIDKDNAPKWSPDTLAGVTDAALDDIFAPLGVDELAFIDGDA